MCFDIGAANIEFQIIINNINFYLEKGMFWIAISINYFYPIMQSNNALLRL